MFRSTVNIVILPTIYESTGTSKDIFLYRLVFAIPSRRNLKGIDIGISHNRPQIHCFFSYTMKPDASKLSSTIDYIFDLARASF